jgi:hypothetical protein
MASAVTAALALLGSLNDDGSGTVFSSESRMELAIRETVCAV